MLAEMTGLLLSLYSLAGYVCYDFWLAMTVILGRYLSWLFWILIAMHSMSAGCMSLLAMFSRLLCWLARYAGFLCYAGWPSMLPGYSEWICWLNSYDNWIAIQHGYFWQIWMAVYDV
jgi:hypothetical protein